MKTTRTAPALRLDLPAPGEIVTSPHCSLRVTAPAAALVAVSIDGGAWTPCRFMAGHWWHEWGGCRAGSHVVSIEARRIDGSVFARAAHTILVRLDQGPDSRETDLPEG